MESGSIKEKIGKILAEIGARAGADLRLSDFHEGKEKIPEIKWSIVE